MPYEVFEAEGGRICLFGDVVGGMTQEEELHPTPMHIIGIGSSEVN